MRYRLPEDTDPWVRASGHFDTALLVTGEDISSGASTANLLLDLRQLRIAGHARIVRPVDPGCRAPDLLPLRRVRPGRDRAIVQRGVECGMALRQRLRCQRGTRQRQRMGLRGLP